MLERSNALRNRANNVLAGGPATLSKMPERYPEGIAPAFLSHGYGPYVWDVDGNKYIDPVAALGPIILGHNYPAVTQAVQQQAGLMASGTLSLKLEVEVAELLTQIIPGAECIRFASNGKDVTEAAVKIARHHTGKRHMIYCGYHGGFADYLITTEGRNTGGILSVISPYNHQVPWGDMGRLEQAMHAAQGDLAAIMLEVPPEPYATPHGTTKEMLERYKTSAHDAGALFLLDEVVTGLRYGLAGAQGYYRVEADLCTLSKAIANGYPLAAITGPRALLRLFDGGHVFLSTTFGAHPVSLAACKATIETLRDTNALTRIVTFGESLVTRMYECFIDYDMPVAIRGNYARFVCDWHAAQGIATTEELRTLWLQELVAHGVLAGVPWFPMATYDETVVNTIMCAVVIAVERISEVVHGGLPIEYALECPVISPNFQRYEDKPSGPF